MKWNRQRGLSLKDKFALHRQAYHDTVHNGVYACVHANVVQTICCPSLP